MAKYPTESTPVVFMQPFKADIKPLFDELLEEYQRCWDELKEYQELAASGRLSHDGSRVSLMANAFRPSSKFIKE